MRKKILAAEDERFIMRYIQSALEPSGYEVVTAYDGREALEKLEQERPDLAILDVMMPYVDGLEVLQSLHNNPATCKLPVIMLLARGAHVEQSVLDQYGITAYLTKPFNPKELLWIVQRIFTTQEGKTDA